MLWLLVGVLACYLGVLALLMLLENRMVYHPVPASEEWLPPPNDRVEDIEVETEDGTRIHAWWCPVEGSPGAILYCHGNAGNLSHRGDSISVMQEVLKESVLIFDYPGYGKSRGIPSETGCYAAADAAYNWLVEKRHIAPERILLHGGSLGGGVAVDLASRRPHRGLVLVNTFTRAPDVGQHWYPWLPIRWLMRNRFDNLAKIGKCKQPVFITAGTADEMIPFTQSEKLFATANDPKCFYRMEGAEHNDRVPAEVFLVLRHFLEKHEETRP
jgi:fermentation-respiration switch protein FrsA (DUF1100 family)